MKEFVLTAPRQLEYLEYSDAALEPNEVRVRSIVSGIKHGTEMTLYRGKTPFIEKRFDPEYRMFMPRTDEGSFFPLRLGSWLVGDVIEVGSAVTRFKVGDRVHGSMWHRPTNTRPEETLYPLNTMNPETALFTDPTIFALAAVHDAEVKVGDCVAVFGMGAIGLIAMQTARLNGAETVIAVDAIQSRLDLAQQFGADAGFNPTDCDPALEIKHMTGGRGVDVAIDISGAYAALHTAIRSIQQCGLIVSASYYSGTPQLELGAEWHHNRPTFRSSMPVWGNPLRCHPLWDLARLESTAMRLLEKGRLIVEPMIGARYPYEHASEAYRMIDEHPEAALKTLLDYGG